MRTSVKVCGEGPLRVGVGRVVEQRTWGGRQRATLLVHQVEGWVAV